MDKELSPQPNILTGLATNFDESGWVSYVYGTLNQELHEEPEVHVTIFNVPKLLMLLNPDSYTPQQVAIGPYHCLRTEVYDMEKYKLAAAKRHQRELPDQKLYRVVDQLMKFDIRIRGFYHKPLNFKSEMLAWMMAVDASFLFEVLLVIAVKESKVMTDDPSKLSYLIAIAGNKTAFNAVLRDIVKLENQIPLFVLRNLLEYQFSSLEVADNILLHHLILLGKELSPFKMLKDLPRVRLHDCAHVLHFLYHFIVPKVEGSTHHEVIEIEKLYEGKENEDEKALGDTSHVKQLIDEVWKILSKMESGAVRRVKAVIFSEPVKAITKVPLKIIAKVPILNMLQEPIEHIFNSFHGKLKEKEDDDKPPLMEEITIPSVTDLSKVGVIFLPTNEGMESIAFDMRTGKFYLPIINLDENSDVVLRNLIAYEACTVPGPLVLTRYTELMNGIIDTEEDAELLRSKGIIRNRLKSDKEVADLWNGMTKSIRLTRVSFLDKVIADVNKYYSGRWKVKFKRFMKKYVFGSWQMFTVLAMILLLLLMCLQAFCQVYSCRRIFHIKALEPALNGE